VICQYLHPLEALSVPSLHQARPQSHFSNRRWEIRPPKKFKLSASEFLDYELLLMRARVRETVSNRPKRGKTMSILKKLREQTRPLGVKEIAELFDVSEATIQRWVRRGEIPAIRVSDTIRFDPGVLADWIEQLSPMSPNQKRGTAGMEDSNA
jgi:excisionase family DNA binding protein